MEEKIKKLIANKLSLDNVDLKAEFSNDLGVDSLDFAELLMEFEKEFNLTIPDDDAAELKTVSDVVEYIKSHSK